MVIYFIYSNVYMLIPSSTGNHKCVFYVSFKYVPSIQKECLTVLSVIRIWLFFLSWASWEVTCPSSCEASVLCLMFPSLGLYHGGPKGHCFLFTEVESIYNIRLVSSAQQRDSVRYQFIFRIIFHYRLLHNIEHSSLCYTVAAYCLFYKIVDCIC